MKSVSFDAFREVLKILNENNIPYMVVGSIAVIIYGDPRLTNDLDLVINIDSNKINDFKKAFGSGSFSCPDGDVILSKIKNQGSFNLVHKIRNENRCCYS